MRKYANDSLLKGEKIVLEAKIHWLLIVGSIPKAIILIGIPRLIRNIISVFTTELVLTNMNIKGKIGLINTDTMDSPLNKINNVKVSSDLFGNLFNYGTVEILTPAGSYYFYGIKDAKKFKQSVMLEIDKFDEARIQKQAEKLASAIK